MEHLLELRYYRNIENDFYISPLKIYSNISNSDNQIEILIKSINLILDKIKNSTVNNNVNNTILDCNYNICDTDNYQINVNCKEILIVNKLLFGVKGVIISHKINTIIANLYCIDIKRKNNISNSSKN